MPKVIDLPTATSMSGSDYLIMESSGGGTKKITRSNALPATNQNIQYAATPTMTSLPSGANTDITSVTVSDGIWLLIGQLKVMGGGDYNIAVGISGASGDLQPSGGGVSVIRATPSDWTVAHATRVIALSAASTTFYLVGYQNSGSSKTLNRYDTSLRAVRLG